MAAHGRRGCDRPIVLVGPMGAGKTSVGRALAQRRTWPFIDLDALVEQRCGCSIATLWARHGAPGLRCQQRRALDWVLATPWPLVVALGGGTFADAAARRAIAACGATTIYLHASPDTLQRRLDNADDIARRPHLQVADPWRHMRGLLTKRRRAYAQAQLTVQTDGYGIGAVVRRVEAALEPHDPHARAKAVPSAPQPEADLTQDKTHAAKSDLELGGAGPHPARDLVATIEFRQQAGPWLAAAIRVACAGAHRIGLVVDAHVARLHAPALRTVLEAIGLHTSQHVIAAGEANKHLGTCRTLYDALAQAGLDRHDALVALGGGVVGDVTGFVASTYKRGVRYVQVPTTTLAAVDASIGGKTGVNTCWGKNLVGTFYPPEAVLVALSHLSTQSRRQHAQGLVEAVKMAVCLNAEFFWFLHRHMLALLQQSPRPLADALGFAVRLKSRVVRADPHERHLRAVLNFGHTLGHAIEAGQNAKTPAHQGHGQSGLILHGEAVALGMVAELEFLHWAGYPSAARAPLHQILLAMNMPTQWRRANLPIAALCSDKKRRGQEIAMPTVPRVGHSQIAYFAIDKLVAFVTDGKPP